MKPMKLDLEYVDIKEIKWGDSTKVEKNILYIKKDEAIAELQDRAFTSIDLDIVRPGESVRIIPVKDVLEPRVKVNTGESFPGVLGGFKDVGEGATRVLRGCAVVTTGSIICYQEGIIDMSGPAAPYIRNSKTLNVVLIAEPVKDLALDKHETAIRLAGLKLAAYLAKAGLEVKPDSTETFELKPVEKKLPKVLYVNLVLSQGLLHDNYIYGGDMKKLQTMLLHPNELLDCAIVSGNCVTASDKNTTYDHANNPVVMDLYRRHGKDLDFCGVVATPSSTMLSGKERGAMSTASLARMVGADVVIVTSEGGGNPEADLMMIAEAVEAKGIGATLLLHETSGDRGDSAPLVDSSEVADAVVTTGNKHDYIELPAMDKTIGHVDALTNLAGYGSAPLRDDGSMKVRLAIIIDANSNLGSTHCTGITY